MRRQRRRRVLVLPPDCSRVEVAGLHVDDLARGIEDRQRRRHTSPVRKATTAGHGCTAGVDTEPIRFNRGVGETTCVQPRAHLVAGGCVELASAVVRIPLNHRIGHNRMPGRRRPRTGLKWWQRSVGVHTGPSSEPLNGIGAGLTGRCGHEVDGVAAMVARPAAPTFMTVAVTVHRHRGAMVVVVGHRAMPPSPRFRACRRLRELVEQRAEVGA